MSVGRKEKKGGMDKAEQQEEKEEAETVEKECTVTGPCLSHVDRTSSQQ